MDIAVLEEFGLTQNESSIYLALCGLGKAHVGEIADRIGLHRKTIYDCLRRLEIKGLVGTFIEEKTKFFVPVNPNRLLDILNEREEELKSQKERIQKTLPELLNFFNKKREKVESAIFKGKEGLKTICEDVVRTKPKRLYSITSAGKVLEVLPIYIERFHRKRVKEGIELLIIFNKNPESKKRGLKLSKMGLTKVKYLPTDYIIPTSIWIYGNKVAFLVWDAELGILIEGEDVSDSFKKHFNTIWKIAKKY